MSEEKANYKLAAFALYDVQMNTYNLPSFFPDQVEAMIMLGAMLKGNSLPAKNPENYELHCIGAYDMSTGKLIGLDKNVYIVRLSNLEAAMKKGVVPPT